MSQQILAPGDPRYDATHYPVTIGDQTQGVVTIENDGKVIVLHSARSHDHHKFVALLEDARRDALPEWVKQVPAVMERIESIFRREKEAGGDPHIKWTVTAEIIRRENLALGTGVQVEVRELRERIARGERLPPAFDRPDVRAVLGIA